MTFEYFDRKYRVNDYLFVTGDISIGEYQMRQYDLLKRYTDELFNSNFGSDAQEKGEESDN